MQHRNDMRSASKGRSLFIWALICIAAGITFLGYVSMSVTAGQGNLIMPLDDVYIHFQYARQIAQGEIYVYNDGLPPTSGATSFLYPFILAFGALIGFEGLSLGLWALGIGAVALAISGGLIYKLGEAVGVWWIGALAALVFVINGATAWHFMSGMETGVVITFMLITLYGYACHRDGVMIFGAVLLCLIRPEGSVFALLALAAHILRKINWQNPREILKNLKATVRWWYALPLLALTLQPLVNLLVTGSAVATGNAAKSLFGLIPPDMPYIISRVIGNFTRILRELFEFRLPMGELEQPIYIGLPIALFALYGLLSLLIRRGRRDVGLLITAWLIAVSAAISTLDTAFWHFKRYQMPLIALVFVLAVFGITRIVQTANGRGFGRWVGMGALIFAVAVAALTNVDFLRSYALNVGYVYAQPYQMAGWLAQNAEPDDVIAVHDVGMMRYMGGHTTLDMVGLTTAGAAEYWRNAPGAIGEFLTKQQPDLIASYGDEHGLGLGYLQQTDLFAEMLAAYTVTLDNARNVALAARTQGIYRPNYAAAQRSDTLAVLPEIYPDVFVNAELLDLLDVADLDSERRFGYRWSADGALGGFPSEFYQFNTIGCQVAPCEVMDGGRRINGEEVFNVDFGAGTMLLVTRLHPSISGEIDIYVNDVLAGTRVIPLLAGAWLEVPTVLDLAGASTIRIVPRLSGGAYMPYQHWFYRIDAPITLDSTDALTQFQDGNISVMGDDTPLFIAENGRRYLDYTFDFSGNGRTTGDYKFFVHVYAADDLDTVVTQADGYLGGGALPLGNWLQGGFRDTIRLDITTLPAGRYRVAIGFYEPVNFERLIPTNGDEQRRFFLADVSVP